MEKKQLDELPPSDDAEFWAEADVHTNIQPKNLFDQKHTLRRIAGHQAQCTHCDWGFQLDPGDRIVNGHLYNKKNEVVI